MVAPHRLSADRTGECYKSLPHEQLADSVADGTPPPPRLDAPAPPHIKVEVGIPLGLTTSVDKGNLSPSTPTPGDGQGPGLSSPEQAQVRAELALLIRWLSNRRPMAPLDGQDWAQHWGSLATFLEADWNEVEWQGIESREDGYRYALEGYWHRLRHARKRPELYGRLSVPLALMDVELNSIRALAEAISSGDRSSELELANRLMDQELQLKTEADEQHPCSTCPIPPESGLDQEGDAERAASPARTYGSLIRDLQHKHGYSAKGQTAVTDAAIRLAQASESALDAQLAASTRRHGCLVCFRASLDKVPTIRRLYEQRKAELAAEIAAERRDRSGSDQDSNGPSPPPSVHLQDGEAKPAVGVSSSNEDAARVLSSQSTAATDGHETVRTEPVQSSTDGSYPSTEDLDPGRLVSPSADGSSPAIVSASDPSSGTEKKSLQHEPSLLLFHSSPVSGLTGNRQSCSVDCGVPLGTQEMSENVLPVEEDAPPDIYASPSPPSGVPNFPDLRFGSVSHHDIPCLLSTRTTTTLATGKKQDRAGDWSTPSPGSIRLDVPAPVQVTAHGNPSLLPLPPVAFAIGYVPASATRRAPLTIVRTSSTGVSAGQVAAICQQRASLAPVVPSLTAPVKPRLVAPQRLFLSAKASSDSIRSIPFRPMRQVVAFGRLPHDDDSLSSASEYGTVSDTQSAFKGPLRSNAGGTSSSNARSSRTKKAPDKPSLVPVQPTGMNLSPASTSPSMSLTPLEPTGPGPPSLEWNRLTSPPDGPSKPSSALPYGCDLSTARGGRVSVDELGLCIVSKLHRTDIEQSRITLELKHHSGVPVLEREVEGGSVVERVSVKGAVMEGAMTEGTMMKGVMTERAMTEGAVREGAVKEGAVKKGAVKEGVAAGGDEHVKPVAKEAKRLGSLTEVMVPIGSLRTTMRSETGSRPSPPPLATRGAYCPIMDPQSRPLTESQSQGHSRIEASTAAATPAVSVPSPAAANDAPRASCPGIGLESREVQLIKSRRRPRVAAEAAAGAASVAHVSCPGAVGHDHSEINSCELSFSPSAAADTPQAVCHSAAYHSHADVKSRGSSFSAAQLQQWRPAQAVLEAGSQWNGAQRRTRPGGAQQLGRWNKERAQPMGIWNKEGAQQVRAVQEGAQQDGAGTADVVAHASGTVTLRAISHVDSERPVPTVCVRESTACANTTVTCSAFRREGAWSPPSASPSSGFSMTLGPIAAMTALRFNSVLSINEDLTAAVPSGIPVSEMTAITSLSAKDTACLDSQESHFGHLEIPAHARTNMAPHPCSPTLGFTTSTKTGYVHNVGSGRFGAAVVVGGMRISSAPGAHDMQMFGGICAQWSMGELVAGLYSERHADMHGQTAPAMWYIRVNSERQEHVYDGLVCTNDVETVQWYEWNRPEYAVHYGSPLWSAPLHDRAHSSEPPAAFSDEHRNHVDGLLRRWSTAISRRTSSREASSRDHQSGTKRHSLASRALITQPYHIRNHRTVSTPRLSTAESLPQPAVPARVAAMHSLPVGLQTTRTSTAAALSSIWPTLDVLVEYGLPVVIGHCSFDTMDPSVTTPRLLMFQLGRSATRMAGDPNGLPIWMDNKMPVHPQAFRIRLRSVEPCLSVRCRRECWSFAPARAVRLRPDGSRDKETRGGQG